MRIVFMGTSEFAVPALRYLNKQHKILAVYCQPPRKAGRGKKLTKSPVHDCADQLNVTVHCPINLKKEADIIAAMQCDFIVVAAYGIILPAKILAIPKFCCLNIHGSILPFWRGASPMQRSILHGDKETGISIMKMDAGVDTGDVLEQQKISLDNKINIIDLTEKLSNIGAECIVKVIHNYDNYKCVTQNHNQATYADKISKQEMYIDWHKSAQLLQNLTRAFYPYAYFIYNNMRIRILEAKIVNGNYADVAYGSCVANSDSLIIVCGDGKGLQLITLQKAGKNPVFFKDFLRGFKVNIGDKLL